MKGGEGVIATPTVQPALAMTREKADVRSWSREEWKRESEKEGSVRNHGINWLSPNRGKI